MKYSLPIAALAASAYAFPAAFNMDAAAAADNLAKKGYVEKDGHLYHPLDVRALPKDPLGISKARTNCGPMPCTTFSKKDGYVSQTGQYAYASPAASDIRGPCPGLNAAANHGYLPRTGIASLEETVAGLQAFVNLSPQNSAFLAAYAITLTGNVAQMVWSIGGPLPALQVGSGILGNGQGLSYSHNIYEGDSSIGRGDAYIYNGDAHSLVVEKFEQVYNLRGKEDRFTLDKFASRFAKTQDYSIAHNPYYFTGAFSTVAVVPAAYNFVINLMSNHSEEEKSGYLNGDMFQSWFAVRGKPGQMRWLKGQEQLPPNWYRRPTSNQYTPQALGGDVAIDYAAYPQALKFGGNTGKVNTFTGVSVEKATNGAFNAKSLLKGDNFACFTYQLAEQGLPDFISTSNGALQLAQKFLGPFISPITKELGCPQQSVYAPGVFNRFPGYKYRPSGNDTNYKA